MKDLTYKEIYGYMNEVEDGYLVNPDFQVALNMIKETVIDNLYRCFDYKFDTYKNYCGCSDNYEWFKLGEITRIGVFDPSLPEFLTFIGKGDLLSETIKYKYPNIVYSIARLVDTNFTKILALQLDDTFKGYTYAFGSEQNVIEKFPNIAENALYKLGSKEVSQQEFMKYFNQIKLDVKI